VRSKKSPKKYGAKCKIVPPGTSGCQR
jgi:hypothetical protein